MNVLSRRQLLKMGIVSGAAVGTLLPGKVFAQTLLPRSADPAFEPDVEIQLTTSHRKVSIIRETSTDVWSYQGKILKGEPVQLTHLPESYLGPIIRVKKGQKVRIFFTNNLSDVSIIHWHGLHVPESADGHPRYVIPQGETYVYEFEVMNRAGTYWFHPHPHGMTGPQVYFGLAGLFLVEDEEEQALSLPSGDFELPMVIQDRRFNPSGSLSYLSSPMERVVGFMGDQILVNGIPDYTIPVSTSHYRLRLLNGSNSRIYKLYLTDGSQFTVIGTDGGLLAKPVKLPYLVLGPAERVDVILDLTKYAVGSSVQLHSMPFNSEIAGMVGRGGCGCGTMGASEPAANGGDGMKIAAFQVISQRNDSFQLPERLSVVKAPDESDAVNLNHPRRFVFEMRAMTPTINGRTFGMDAVASDEIVRLNTSEIWEIYNAGGHMAMPHPVHIHGLQFRILGRSGSPAEFKDGYVDSGWKDTVLLMPGEAARLLLRFKDFSGLYLYHCHNLEHEDLGMMRNYRVAV